MLHCASHQLKTEVPSASWGKYQRCICVIVSAATCFAACLPCNYTYDTCILHPLACRLTDICAHCAKHVCYS